MNWEPEVGKLYIVNMSYVYMWIEPLGTWAKTHTRIVLEKNDIIILTSNKTIQNRHQTSWLTKRGPCYYEFNIECLPCMDVLND